jgi:hypothetical protein
MEISTNKSITVEDEGLASKNQNINHYKKQNIIRHSVRVKNFGIHSEFSVQMENLSTQ